MSSLMRRSTSHAQTPWLHSQTPLLRHDKWLLSCLTWVPVVLALSIWMIFSQGIARNLPVGVVDLSHSQMSRQLSFYIDSTSTLKISNNYSDVGQAKDALISGDIYAYIIIPSQFDKQVLSAQRPQVSVFYNSQYILIGKLINSAIVQAQGTFNAQIETIKDLAKGNSTPLSAIGQALPVRTQITPLFNKNSNYAQFLVSAIIPALWQVVIVVSTIMILSANYRHHGLTQWLGSRYVVNVSRTLLGYVPLFVLQGIAFLCWFYYGMKWPMNGTFAPLIFAQLTTIIACMIMGSFFFFMTLDAARAMSFAGAFTAPSFAFMGITFPVTDMNNLAQIWRALLPISHYIEVQVSQVSYGAGAAASLSHLVPMLGYALPAWLTVLLIKKHWTNEQLNTHQPIKSEKPKTISQPEELS
ncbi:ABC transporter permease [Vibrio paucivorans]